ncbi:MAG TPA: TolC family protein [Bryobacteraceae bacterium]|nr:TolC family protein [Bryobacteraceae bacterium]
MQKGLFFLFLAIAGAACGEVRTMTLREAVDLALKQNPDLMLARLDQLKARQQVTIAHDPFTPKVFAGSGAAWTSGYPANIEGQAPSILQLRTQWTLFDRPQSYQVAAAKENARTAEIDTSSKQDDVLYRVAGLYLDAEQSEQGQDAAQLEADNLANVLKLVQARVQEQRELPIEAMRANVSLERAKNAVESFTLDAINAETSLAMALGLGPDDRVRAVREERTAFQVPQSEEQTIATAIANSRALKRLESQMQAKTLEIKGYKAERLPKVDAIAQYEMFAKYYTQNYFPFQRNNEQLGASFSVPVLAGKSARAYIEQDDADLAKLRIEVNNTRAQITADLRRAYQEVRKADSARELAQADLELAREQVSLDLAQYNEGRLPMATLEQARAAENDKYVALYASENVAQRARLNLLHLSGTLQAAIH